MHEVCFVLEQFVNTFNDVPLSEQDFVPHGHEFILHIGLEPVYEMDPLVEKMLKEFLLDISSVGEHLPIEFLSEHLPYPFVSVINVRPCKTKSYHLSTVVAQQM